MVHDDLGAIIRIIMRMMGMCPDCMRRSHMPVIKRDLSGLVFMCPVHAYLYVRPTTGVSLPSSLNGKLMSITDWKASIKLPKKL